MQSFLGMNMEIGQWTLLSGLDVGGIQRSTRSDALVLCY